jgi:aspartyl-tRNA(Asn)/glutamyl-tRNA(Gln) amidotransferase subunit A
LGAGQIWQLDAAALKAAYESGEATAAGAVSELGQRIEDLNGDIGAFTTLTLDRARDDAQRLDAELAAGHDRGPLHGIPVGIKELFDVESAVTTYGSPMLADRVASADGEAVARLRRAGCIVMGLTRSHEFGWGITNQNVALGSTRNPWDLDRVPGGSSGGSAAAVGSGMVPLALGSDTGGSIRIPSAFRGAAGFKPTYGTVSKAGAVALAPSLDHPGPIARTVADLASAIVALAGYDAEDPTTLRRDFDPPDLAAGLAGVRIGLCEDLHYLEPTSDHRAVFDRAVEAAAAAGAEVVAVELPEAGVIRGSFAATQMAEARQYHEADLGF